MRKITFLITLPELGGAQTHVYEILRALDRKRYDPLLLTSGEGWLTQRAAELGIRCRPLRHLRRAIHPLADALALAELCAVLRTERPDILHLHSSKAGILGRIAGRLCRVPRVAFTAHGFSFHERLKPRTLAAFVALEKLLAPLADVIVPVSDYDRRRALGFGVGRPDRLMVVHNGIETARLQAFDRASERRALGLEAEDLVVGMVARFAFPKDQIGLLRAAQPLLAGRGALKILFVGSGPAQAQAAAVAKELGIERQVRFLGDRTDVPALLAAMDVFALISSFEALPMTIIEAMAAGLPVVASDVGGVRELVADGATGLCVPAGSPEALHAALARLAGDPALRQALGRAGMERARAEFDVSVMMSRLEAAYGEAPWQEKVLAPGTEAARSGAPTTPSA